MGGRTLSLKKGFLLKFFFSKTTDYVIGMAILFIVMFFVGQFVSV